MNDPVRLRDEADSAVELLLLEAGTDYRSSENARLKTLAALGLAGSAAVSVGALSVAGSSAKIGWAKLLVISSIGAGVVAPVGYVVWNRSQVEPLALSVSAPSQAPVAARAVAPAAQQPSVEEISPLPPAVPAAKLEPRTAATSALAAELGALDAVRSRLSSGDATGALAKLDDYARTYPRGRLVLEAEVLRIDALAHAGQRDQAKKRAEAFLRRHPNSVLASRVRGFLD